jgi:hypothetical protein
MESYCSLPLPILIFSQINRVHVVYPYSFTFQFGVILSSVLLLGVRSGTLLSGFRTKVYFFPAPHASCMTPPWFGQVVFVKNQAL